jgi:alpha-ribazole phosphatase
VRWLVRHAAPLVERGVCYGALDVPADPLATQIVAQALAQQLPQHAQLHTSPLQRCELLTHTLCALRPDLSYKKDARLAEMNFGTWEGQPWDRINAEALAQWTANFWQYRAGGGENVAEVMARVVAAWADTQAGCQAGQAQVWITHAGVVRAASLLAKGVFEIHDAALWPSDAPAYGQWWHWPAG